MSEYVFKYKTVDGNALTDNEWISEYASGEQYQEDGWWCVPVEYGDYGVYLLEGSFENTNITEVDTGDAVVAIGDEDRPFKGCNYLKKVYIGKNVTSIIEGLFMWNSNLETIVIDPENETYDSRCNCNAIIQTEYNTLMSGCKYTIIPDTIEEIGYFGFYKIQITSLTCLPTVPPTIYSSTFGDTPENKTLYVPKESVSAYQESDWADYFETITQIPEPEPPTPPQSYGFNFEGMIDTDYMREI